VTKSPERDQSRRAAARGSTRRTGAVSGKTGQPGVRPHVSKEAELEGPLVHDPVSRARWTAQGAAVVGARADFAVTDFTPDSGHRVSTVMKTVSLFAPGNICRSRWRRNFPPAVRGSEIFGVFGRLGRWTASAQPVRRAGRPGSWAMIFRAAQPHVDSGPGRASHFIFGHDAQPHDTVGLLYPQAIEKTFLLRELTRRWTFRIRTSSDPSAARMKFISIAGDQIEQASRH